jgi:hypothetical protein
MADSERTKRLKEAPVDEDMGPIKRGVKAGAVKISEMFDRMGIKQEDEYPTKKGPPTDWDEMQRETRGQYKRPEKFKVPNMAKGGKIKSASARADGCAIRGKTRGKMV